MTTVILQNVGAAIGGAVAGPVGAMIGRAAGAVAGSAVDQQIFSKDRVIEGPRLDATRVFASNEAAPIPRVYGRNRIGGEIIWATRFEERVSESGGGKGTGGSATSRTYSYFANFAVGLCEGPVSCLRRVWADGKEIDLTRIEYRFYRGTEDQNLDPLIEAKQGIGNAPAYRGLAYIVFESLPLGAYGNRIPQLEFEVIRSIGKLEKDIRAITVIPGSTEYGYSPKLVGSGGGEAVFNAHNRHTYLARTDWQASIDELQALCPNLESVSLVVAWFGNDLRAGECEIHPGVTTHYGASWSVAGRLRHQAHLVSQIDGLGAYGGTPSDTSLRDAILDLKARGLRVVLYPFVMMDVPAENTLPDPYGGVKQSVYPWRGEITCHPAPGKPGTVDKTVDARNQIDAFANRVSGSYRSFVMHYAQLCADLGGVDGFLLGSEMRGVTRIRDQNGNFPFVGELVDLAADIRQILGSGPVITYASDWSEYFGYQPEDGSGDVIFNLDPLWASPDIDAIGIDNYMPLSDWRDAGDPESAVHSPHEPAYLQSSISGNEGFDWYYQSDEDRENGIRTPIADGQGEAWIYRYKDLLSWWENTHHNRYEGVRSATSTPWVPQSKPFFFTEIGCPAVDKGANQPNVFHDPKSEQSALPYFSSGGRDDLIQRRFLEAHYAYWSEPENNPVSPVYGGPMVSVGEIAPWSWDARPFPWFPLDTATWSDGDNWHGGHWLNGRLGSCPLDDLIAQVLADHGHAPAIIDVDGYVDGFVIPAQASARATLEPLLRLFNVNVSEDRGQLVFRSACRGDAYELSLDELVHEDDDVLRTDRRSAELELPGEVVINHASVFSDYEPVLAKSGRLEGGSDRQITLSLPVTMQEGNAIGLATRYLRENWSGRDECRIALSSMHLGLAVGDIVRLGNEEQRWIVESIDIGVRQDLLLKAAQTYPAVSGSQRPGKRSRDRAIIHGPPQAVLFDLPIIGETEEQNPRVHLAISARPWAGQYAAFSSPSDDGFNLRAEVSRMATTGKLLTPLMPGPVGRKDHSSRIRLSLNTGFLSSVETLAMLNGANMALVESESGAYELIGYSKAELLQDGSWEVSGLLRAQYGTDDAMLAGASVGGRFILLDDAVTTIGLEAHENGVEQNWHIGPATEGLGTENFVTLQHHHSARAKRMYSPVHLHVSAIGTSLRITWIRRGRLDSDSWINAEIPMDAATERYTVTVRNMQGDVVRTDETALPEFAYLATDRLADLGSQDAAFHFEVAQLGSNGLPGGSAARHWPGT